MTTERPFIEITLKTPIKRGSETIEVLRIRKPLARDLRNLRGEPSFGDLLDIAAVLANVPASTLGELEVEDAMRVTEVVGGFFPDSPATGD